MERTRGVHWHGTTFIRQRITFGAVVCWPAMGRTAIKTASSKIQRHQYSHETFTLDSPKSACGRTEINYGHMRMSQIEEEEIPISALRLNIEPNKWSDKQTAE